LGTARLIKPKNESDSHAYTVFGDVGSMKNGLRLLTGLSIPIGQCMRRKLLMSSGMMGKNIVLATVEN